MNFISGFLGLCSAVGTGTATEIVGAGYARQPVSFGPAKNGLTVSDQFDFGMFGISVPIVGRAVYDAPSGGHLLLVLPHQVSRPPAEGSIDRAIVTLVLTALAGYPDAAAYNGNFSALATLGLVYDSREVVGITSTAPNVVSGVTALPLGNGQYLQVQGSSVTAGVGLTIQNGQLCAS